MTVRTPAPAFALPRDQAGSRRLAPSVGLAIAVLALNAMGLVRPGTAANYYVYLDTFHNGSGPTPVRLVNEYVQGNNIVREIGDALPGSVSGFAEVESHWIGGGSDGAYSHSQVQASTDDFVITGGPESSVQGTFYFTISVGFRAEGGYPGHGSNGGNVGAFVTANGAGPSGSAHSNNGGYGGDGVLAGLGPEGGAVTAQVAGTFPVGVPFSVSIGMNCEAFTYGNETYAPARGRGCLGLEGPAPGIAIGDGSGAIMSLPAGYTVNSASWGVSDNQRVPVADVPGTIGREFRFEGVTPNPSATSSQLALTLPEAGDLALTVVDVQGREVRTLASGRFGAGAHTFVWDGRDEIGRAVPAGIYFAIARTGAMHRVQRVVRVR